jgi:hypothetical protein
MPGCFQRPKRPSRRDEVLAVLIEGAKDQLKGTDKVYGDGRLAPVATKRFSSPVVFQPQQRQRGNCDSEQFKLLSLK